MTAEKQKTYFWTDEETAFMLRQLKEQNILKFMDGRKTRNAALFKKVSEQLKEAGFIRTAEQIRVRWKHIKQNYQSAKKKDQTSGHTRVVCPFSDILEELLGNRPASAAADHGVDIGVHSESVAGVEDLEEKPMEGLLAPKSEDEDSVSFPTSDREWSRNSTPQLERPASAPPIDLPGTRPQQTGSTRPNMADFDLLFQRMEEFTNSWRQHLQRSEEREERLVNSIIQSNATMVSALLEGIRSLRPAVTPQPTTPSNPSQAPHPGTDSGSGSGSGPVYVYVCLPPK